MGIKKVATALARKYKARKQAQAARNRKATATKFKKNAKQISQNRNSRNIGRLHQTALPNIPGHGAGGTFSVYNMRMPLRGWLAGLKKTGASNFLMGNSAGRITSPIGLQGYFLPATTYTGADILLQNATSTNKTFKVLLESITEKTIYRNQEGSDCYLTLYDIICRRDMNTSDVNNDPRTAWSQGETDAGATNMAIQVGCTPFSSPRFTQFFKVVKVTHVILPAGGTHEHRVHYEPNKLLNQEVVQDSGNIRNLTHYTMATVYGAPDNDATTKTVVSIGTTSVDFVQTKQYRWSYLSDSTSNNAFTQSLPTTYATTEAVFNDESGVVNTTVLTA